jgi:hypothetical protein
MFFGVTWLRISSSSCRRHLPPDLLVQLPTPPAVAQGQGHGPLGVVLADDVPVQLGHDLSGGQVVAHGSSSTVMHSFV